MFGTLGGPELLLILVIALIVFGPRKLPEIGKSIGKMMVEFRRASNDFKRTIEDEVEADKLRSSLDPPRVETIAAEPPPSEQAPSEPPPSEPVVETAAPEGTVSQSYPAPSEPADGQTQDAAAEQK